MATYDLDTIRMHLHSLTDSAISLEDQFRRDHPEHGGHAPDDRDARISWLTARMEAPTGVNILFTPDDHDDQSEWTLSASAPAGMTGYPDLGSIPLNAHSFFGISHWLMTYCWWTADEPLP